ncbi:MAG: glycosyltransferase family 4 protein [Lachnospiraceae bacterium]|nr:glycosyltransferase family 4 protein [Lachnospiraceae bacterium]
MNEKKIRILHVAQASGGVDRYIRMLFKYMDHNKYENILVCSYDFKKEDYSGLADKFEQLDMRRPIGVADLKATMSVRKLIKQYKPDIVYAHSSKAGVIARVADIGIDNVCVYNPHGWAFNMKCSKKKQMLYAIIERIAAALCKKIVCISEAEKKSALVRKICREDKLQVIFNGVDIEAYEKRKKNGLNKLTREVLGISKEAFVVGMVGRISEQKAPDVFIRAAKLIKQQIHNSYFIIVGNGEQKKSIEKYARENNLSNSLLITGWVEHPIDYVELFDIAMLLSRWEGFGLVLPEYMMAGKPIVATKVDAIPDIIKNQVNGLLVETDDVEAVCKSVIELHENNNLREQLVVNGKEDVHKKFDVTRVSHEHNILFLNLLNRDK